MLLFLNISGGEILVILVVVYLVFGPKKIPELARMLGKGINEMRRATNEIKDEINREINKAKKDINLDIDRGDPLGFKKKMDEAMNGTEKKKDPTPADSNKAAAHGPSPGPTDDGDASSGLNKSGTPPAAEDKETDERSSG